MSPVVRAFTVVAAGIAIGAACSNGEQAPMSGTTPPPPAASTADAPVVTTSRSPAPPTTEPIATSNPSVTARSTSPQPATTESTSLPGTATPGPEDTPPIDRPLHVAWVGGSEVELRDVSLPAYANQLGLMLDDRVLNFVAYTQIAASATDSATRVRDAARAGAEALIVTINPQWLYGRICEGVEPPHARYACLLEITPVTGDVEIAALGEAILATGLPTLLVLIPTSATAIESPELAEPIAVANDRLLELLPAGPDIAVLDERLTAGRDEYREGVGFYDMVHTTPTGARQLAGEIANELLRLLQGDR